MSVTGKQTKKMASKRNNRPSCWPGCLYRIGLNSKESRRIIDSNSLLPGIKTRGSTNWVRAKLIKVVCSEGEVGRRQVIAERGKGWHGV